MTLLDDAHAWASVGAEPLFDQYVRKPQRFRKPEVAALVRAAYTLGYVDAMSADDPAAGLPILRACQFSEALRLTLPLSS